MTTNGTPDRTWIAARPLPVILAVGFGLHAPHAWAGCEKPTPVRFAPGTSSSKIEGSIPRGETACYTIAARAGQTLSIVQLDRGEGNIALQLYRPGWKVSRIPDGYDLEGTGLPGAEDGADAPEWTGPLPATGQYLMLIGTTRGSGGYSIRVEIR